LFSIEGEELPRIAKQQGGFARHSAPVNKACERVQSLIGSKPIPLRLAKLSQAQTFRRHSNIMKKIIIIAAIVSVGAWGSVRAADVKETWEKTCQKCHGEDGKGQTKMGQKSGVKDFTDAKVQADFTDEKAFKSIKEGIKDGDKTKMKPAEGLSDEEIKALVAHTRGFKK
jgi:cytochrome c553